MVRSIELDSVSRAALEGFSPTLEVWGLSPLTGDRGVIEGPDVRVEYNYDGATQRLTMRVERIPSNVNRGEFIGMIINAINAHASTRPGDGSDRADDATCTCASYSRPDLVYDLFCIELTNDLSLDLTYETTVVTHGLLKSAKQHIPAGETVDCALVTYSTLGTTGGTNGTATWKFPDNTTRLQIVYNGPEYGDHSCIPSFTGKGSGGYQATITNSSWTSGDSGCPRVSKPQITIAPYPSG